MSDGYVIIVKKTGGAIDEDTIIIREDLRPALYAQILEIAEVDVLSTPLTFLWPTNSKVLTQAFGNNPAYYGQWGLPGHEGLDMRAYMGTPIIAAFGGEVIGNYNGTAYGWAVKIKAVLRGDEYEATYAHMESQSKLTIGQKIQKGDYIGPADSTGNSTGSHLHFTLKKKGATASGETKYKNNIIDPTNFFAELRD